MNCFYMYEGLTKEIIEKSLFGGMDLSVASGKITNQVDSTRPGQNPSAGTGVLEINCGVPYAWDPAG